MDGNRRNGRGGSVGEVFLAFGRLGLTAFGGPLAHIGHFRETFVTRRRWLDDAAFADLVALCQFLPGPASSQVGMAIGLMRAGRLGALAAFVGFTAPSAIALLIFAATLGRFGGVSGGLSHGLEVAAVAVVAVALLGMVRTLAATRATATIAAAALGLAVVLPGVVGQVAAIVVGGIAGRALAGGAAAASERPTAARTGPIGRGEGAAWLVLFAVVSIGLPIAAAGGAGVATLVDGFWRAGSLVFGGGHVVLPLLEAEMVTPGRVAADTFLAGYGATQAMPGPLFTFAAFLGSVSTVGPGGVVGGTIALAAIFAPSWVLVAGCLPFWDRLRRARGMRAAMVGINAAVVGLLGAAFFDPVWGRAIQTPRDAALATAAFVALQAWRVPPWAVVVVAAVIGAALGR